MRKVILLLAGLITAIAQPANAAFKVFACEPEWAALARELGGEQVETWSATTAMQDAHKIQARPSLIAKFRQADLVICTGADLEIGWLSALIQKANNPRVLPGSEGFMEASRHVAMLEVPVIVDRSLGDVHPYGNPHIHTDPRNIVKVAAVLAERLAKLDAANADAYRQRHADFIKRWNEAIRAWEARAQPLRGLRFVAMHKDWSYMARWLGLEQAATLEPKPGIPPSAAQLSQVLDALQAKPAAVILLAAYQDRKAAEWLSQRSGLPILVLPFTVGGSEFADDLPGLYANTIDALLAATGKTEVP